MSIHRKICFMNSYPKLRKKVLHNDTKQVFQWNFFKVTRNGN